MNDIPDQLKWTKELLDRFWAWEAQCPEHYFTNRYGKQISRVLRAYIRKGHRVLDYGCGLGFLCKHLVYLEADVWATDESSVAIDITNRRNMNLKKFQGAFPVNELIRSKRRFDRIVGIEVIEHLTDNQLTEFFLTVSTLLKRGGFVFLTTPNEENLSLNQVYCPVCNHVFHRWQHVRVFSAKTLMETIEENGLSVNNVFTTDFSDRFTAKHNSLLLMMFSRIFGNFEKNSHLIAVAQK